MSRRENLKGKDAMSDGDMCSDDMFASVSYEKQAEEVER